MTTPTPRDIELAKDALTGVLIARGTACESMHAPILSAIAIARAEEREAIAEALLIRAGDRSRQWELAQRQDDKRFFSACAEECEKVAATLRQGAPDAKPE